MIQKAKRRMLLVSNTAVFVILIVVMFVISMTNLRNVNMLMDEMTDNIDRNEHGAKWEMTTGAATFFRFNDNSEQIAREAPFSTRYFVVVSNEKGDIIDCNIDNISSVSKNQAERYGQTAINKDKSRGWIRNYRYKKSVFSGGIKITFVDGAMNKEIANRFLITTTIILLCLGVIVSILLKYLFDKIFFSVEEGYEKQKRFITDVNHELKTPLTIITTNLEIMEMEQGSDEWIKDTLSECGRMTRLISQLSQLTKIDEAEEISNISEYNLSELVESAISEFEILAMKRNLAVKSNLEKNIYHRGDDESIRQLVGILMDNAIKYCDDAGQIHVALTRSRRIILSIENTYQNVDDVQLDKLFDRFYREDKARTYNGGSGIGLSIAEEIVTRYKGEISAYKKGGATIGFRIILK